MCVFGTLLNGLGYSMTGLHQTQDKPSTAIPKKSPLGFERAKDLSSYTVPKDQILDFFGICVPGAFLNGPCCSMTGVHQTQANIEHVPIAFLMRCWMGLHYLTRKMKYCILLRYRRNTVADAGPAF